MEWDWDALIAEHYAPILRAAFALTRDRWEADDLAQEAFVRAMESARRYRGDGRVRTWLYGILLRVHHRRRRDRARLRDRLWRAFLRTTRWAEPPADVGPDRDDGDRSLWAEVSRLPEAQQHVLVLRYAEGLPIDQVAEAMGIPVGTVKSRTHHALAALRERIDPEAAFDMRPTSTTFHGTPLLSSLIPPVPRGPTP